MSIPDKKERLELLIRHFSNNKNTDFARLIGVSPQAISSWMSRKSYDIELLYSKCVNISAHWLLTGEGEMLRSDHDQQPVASAEPTYIYRSDPKDQEIIELQRKHIKLLEDKLSRLEDKTLGLGIAPSVDFTPPLMGAPANPSVYRSPRKK